MSRVHATRASASLALVLGLLPACAAPTRYQNTAHPTYGDAEYKTDLAQCRQQNSKTTTTQGYDLQTVVTVDEPRAAACMTTRGWQPASK
jgi:hypothetical protein